MSGSAPGTLVPHEDVHSVNTYRAHATLLTALTREFVGEEED